MSSAVPDQGDFITLLFDPQSRHEQSGDFRSRSGKIIGRAPAAVINEVLAVLDAVIY